MKPARGLFTPKARARHRNVDRDDGDIRLVQFVHDDSPELGVRLKLNDKIDVTAPFPTADLRVSLLNFSLSPTKKVSGSARG